MGYNLGKSAPSLLRMNYEKYLYPYDIFQAGAFTGDPPPVCVIVSALCPFVWSLERLLENNNTVGGRSYHSEIDSNVAKEQGARFTLYCKRTHNLWFHYPRLAV